MNKYSVYIAVCVMGFLLVGCGLLNNSSKKLTRKLSPICESLKVQMEKKWETQIIKKFDWVESKTSGATARKISDRVQRYGQGEDYLCVYTSVNNNADASGRFLIMFRRVTDFELNAQCNSNNICYQEQGISYRVLMSSLNRPQRQNSKTWYAPVAKK